MKKLMVAFVAVALATAANAVTFAWGTGPAVNYGTTWDSESYNSGTYYLIQGDASAAELAINTILAGGAENLSATFAAATASAVNYGDFNTETFAIDNPKVGNWSDDLFAIVYDSSDTASMSYYQLILDQANNAVYVSEVLSSDYTTVGATTASFGNDSDTTFGADVKTYQGSGWYTAESVPEPTSGLLLLLGVAGLALRRRRA